jgi:prophage tail gpP-like protein
MITIEIDGVEYTNFTSLSVSFFLDSIADEFVVSAVTDITEGFPVKQRATCRALVEGVPVVTGYIEQVSGSYDSKSYTIEISGKDKTVDVVDTTCAEDMTFEGETTLHSLIEQSLEKCGVTDIKVINEVDGLEPFSKKDLEAAQTGESLFAFIERHARKRQVLLTSNGNGDIVITRSADLLSGFELINKPNDPRNNIIAGDFNLDDSQRYNKYIFTTQDSPSFGEFSTDSEDATNKDKFSTDSQIRITRIYRAQAESPLSNEELQDRADWEANNRRIRSLSYSCKVAGHTIPGTKTPIPVNKLVKVDDSFANISSVMLINRVVYNLTKDDESTTIGLVNKSAYTLQAEFSKFEKRTNEESFDFLEEDVA